MANGRTEINDLPGLALLAGVGMSGAIWQPLLPLLPEFVCHTPDMPGHGIARDVPWRSLEASARHILDGLPDNVTHLAGVSLGAYVGLHMMRLQPDRFETAVLSGIHPGGMPGRVMMKVMSATMSLLVRQRWAARRNLRMMRIPEEQYDVFLDAAAATRPSAFRRATNDVVDFALPGGLEHVNTKVIAASGGNEHPLIRDGIEEVASAFNSGNTYIAEGLGHSWPIQDPAQFADLVRRNVT